MSTPLSELSMPQEQHPDLNAQQQFDVNQMIDDVSNQLNNQTQDQNGPDMNASAMQYQMDQSQIPQQEFHEPQQMSEQEYQMMAQNPYAMMGMPEPEPELSLTEKVVKEVKLPLFVIALVMVLSLPQFNRLLTGFVPKFLAENGEMTMVGLLSKAVLAGVLFFLFKLFV